MTNLKQNKDTKSGKKLLNRIRILIIGILTFGTGGYFYNQNLNKTGFVVSPETSTLPKQDLNYTYLPTASGQVVHHTYYSLSYMEAHEQPEWVAYILTKKSIQVPNLKRAKDFNPDKKIKTYSANSDDYKGSGYTRGHLVPAGDMAFNEKAMNESFFMSNMSPQLRQFNNGVWRELEDNVRDWAYQSDSLYVISGPIFSKPIKQIGQRNKITVPSAFYKVILDNKTPARKAIGFIIPHELSEQRLETYMVPVSQVETITGIKFFTQMPDSKQIELLKTNIQPQLWQVNEKRYNLRVSKWNYE